MKTQEILLANRGAEGIRRGQDGDNESASFKIAEFQNYFRVIYGCQFKGVGAVLNQEQRPVVFASRTLVVWTGITLRRRDVQIRVNERVLIKTHPLSSATKKVVAKFKPEFERPYRVLEVKKNNVVIWRSGKRLTVNVDQVRIYHHRKSDEMEIRTGSSDSNSSRHKSSSFESVQQRSNESHYDRKKGSGVKRELEEKGRSFLKRKIRVRCTQVRPKSAVHLSDHHLALG
ncbi:uncharacterized protein TNCV_5127871 [Trichonephila clavipes]|nr:uncharacterized protein TNCV_5127871 [Trichonephila clavipes]